jgi:hypothetical protein
MKPEWSVLCPRGPSAPKITVFTARIAVTSGSSMATRPAANSL